MDMMKMKKEAAKEALQDLIKEMLGVEGKMMAGGDDEEGEMPEAVEDVEEKADDVAEELPGMTEEDLQEKRDYLSGKKKPVMKKSLTVVMGAPVEKLKLAKKKMKHG